MVAKIELTREVVAAEIARREALRKNKAECESDFLAFVRYFWRVLEPEIPLIEGWVLDCLADTLMAVTDGHLTRVCINVPPGSLKSSLLNVFFPAWEWGPQNMPHLRYLSVSYSTAVPERDNIRFARLIRDPVYQQLWGDRVKLVRDGAEVVENNRTGWKRVTSTGGSITGLRGDRLCLDDLNNPGSVESEEVRGTSTRFVREIMPDRLNSLDRSAIINLQQRTHEEDATGTLIQYGQGYVFVCIPMEFDPLRIQPVTLRRDKDGNATQVWTDPRGLGADGRLLDGLYTNARGEPRVRMGSPMAKAEGSLCWPERFSPDAVDKLRAEKGPYAWSSQYNQFPGVRGGSIIRKDWWKLWKDAELPEMGTVLASLDTAVEEGTQNDYNALTVWGAFAGEEGEPRLLLIEAWRVRAPLAELVAKVAETCRRRRVDFLLIEHKTRGRDVHDEIARIYWDATWQTVLVKAELSKIARLKAVEHLFSGDYRRDTNGVEYWEGGMVYAPDREFADEVIAEVASFPYGAHDDYVDTVSQLLGYVRKNGVVLRKVEWEAAELAAKRYRRAAGVPYAIGRR